MEIQLYKALTEAGITQDTAIHLTEAMERDIRERINEARKELASRADIENLRRELAEAKTEILKWTVASIFAATGIALAVAKMMA